jgi:hypothetical protein
VLAPAGDTEGEREQRTCPRERVNSVESAVVTLTLDQCAGADQDRQSNRDVDEEHGPPAQQAGEDATEQHTNGDPQG